MKKYFFTVAFFAAFLCGAGAGASGLRIVSLKPNITDIVYALGEGDRLVGVTKYCDVPQGQVKPAIVADYTRPYTERIMALSPDIVLGSRENSSRRSIESLEKMGIGVRLLPFTTIRETESSIRAIGELLGIRQRGDELAEKFSAEIFGLKKKWKDYPLRRVIVVWGVRPIVVAGPGTYMDELLEFISASNAVKDTRIKYPHIGIEEMIALEPDAIIDLSMGSEAQEKEGGRPWDNIGAIRAVREGRVIAMDVSKFRAGPNLPAALNKLAREIRPLTRDH